MRKKMNPPSTENQKGLRPSNGPNLLSFIFPSEEILRNGNGPNLTLETNKKRTAQKSAQGQKKAILGKQY